jgi:hypothetical protein
MLSFIVEMQEFPIVQMGAVFPDEKDISHVSWHVNIVLQKVSPSLFFSEL